MALGVSGFGVRHFWMSDSDRKSPKTVARGGGPLSLVVMGDVGLNIECTTFWEVYTLVHTGLANILSISGTGHKRARNITACSGSQRCSVVFTPQVQRAFCL